MSAFFWIGGGANSNWGTVGNWSSTSGGTSNGSTPSSTSDVTFDGAGVNGNTASTVAASITVLSLTFSSGYTNTVTINNTITLTVAGNFTDNTAHNWTVTGTGNLVLSATATVTSGGKTFPGQVTLSGSTTKTLSGDWTITGNLIIGIGTQTLNSGNINAGAGLSMNGIINGTGKIVMNGTGTISGSTCNINLDINTSGTITFSNPSFGGSTNATLKYVAGTIAASPTFQIGGNVTLDLSSISWTTVSIAPASGITVTLNSNLIATTLNLSGSSIAFGGTATFKVTTLNINNTVNTNVITLANGITYNITSALNAFKSPSTFITITSDHATNRANIFLQNDSSTCNVAANLTRINATGRPIVSFNGTITDCINVATFSNVLYKPTASFNRGFRRASMFNANKAVIYTSVTSKVE